MNHIRTNLFALPWPALACAMALALPAQAQRQERDPGTAGPASGAQRAGQEAAQTGGARPGTSWAREQGLRASRVIGSSVRNPQGRDIGQIEDMVVNMNTGKARYAVLRFDPGFLRFERVYAVPVQQLRMVDGLIVIDIARERLEQSGIESAGWSKDYFSDRARIARLDSDWGLGQPGPEQLVRASDLINMPIVSTAGADRIGRIEELVFSPSRERVQYAVVSFERGWLGADKRAAVDLSSLHRNSRNDALSLVVDRATVNNMRPFTEDRYGHFGDGSFVNREGARTLGGPPSIPVR